MAVLVFVAIVACGIDLQYVWLLADFVPDGTPQYDLYLREVARRTPPDASIAIRVATPRFEPDYAYYYYRAVYQLAGRRVVPLMDRDDREHLDRMANADYIAAWASTETFPHPLVWKGHHGALYRRAR